MNLRTYGGSVHVGNLCESFYLELMGQHSADRSQSKCLESESHHFSTLKLMLYVKFGFLFFFLEGKNMRPYTKRKTIISLK